MPATPALVFIVDDDEDDRFLVIQALRLSGATCQVTPLASGSELLSQLSSGEQLPRLIVLDLNMPFMDGLEVLEQLRQTYSDQELPVVIMTTSDQAEDKHQAAELKANDFITKPATAEQYIQFMRSLRARWLTS